MVCIDVFIATVPTADKARCLARAAFQRAIDAQFASFKDIQPEGENT